MYYYYAKLFDPNDAQYYDNNMIINIEKTVVKSIPNINGTKTVIKI